MKSALKTAKGLGSNNHGFSHWWLQRLTAISLVFFSLWFVSKIVCLSCHQITFTSFLENKFNSIIFTLFLIVALLHSTLGIKVIVEDYIHCEKTKFAISIISNLFAWLTAAILIFTLI